MKRNVGCMAWHVPLHADRRRVSLAKDDGESSLRGDTYMTSASVWGEVRPKGDDVREVARI